MVDSIRPVRDPQPLRPMNTKHEVAAAMTSAIDTDREIVRTINREILPTLRGVEEQIDALPGEANTVSNDGSGKEVSKAKVGVDFPFRTLEPGTGIGMVEATDDITVSLVSSVNASASAAADSGAGTANITADVVIVTTVASGHVVTLRPAVAGETQRVMNKGANTLKLFCQSADTVDGGASVTLAVDGLADYTSMSGSAISVFPLS